MTSVLCPRHDIRYDPAQGCYMCGIDRIPAPAPSKTCTECGRAGTFTGSYSGINPAGDGILSIREICPDCTASLRSYGDDHRAEYDAILIHNAERRAASPYTRSPGF